MPVRHEDKEFIQALSLLGALLGACLGVFAVMHFSHKAQQKSFAHNEYQQTHAALLKLQSTVVNPNNPIADEKVLDQVQHQIQQTPAPEKPVRKNVWTHLPRWGYWGICGGGGFIGAVTGYSLVWSIGWIGTVIIYCLVRFLYGSVRIVAPGYASRIHLPQKGTPYQGLTQRMEGRVLPTLVKLMFLIVFILGILAAAVWHLTAI